MELCTHTYTYIYLNIKENRIEKDLNLHFSPCFTSKHSKWNKKIYFQISWWQLRRTQTTLSDKEGSSRCQVSEHYYDVDNMLRVWQHEFIKALHTLLQQKKKKHNMRKVKNSKIQRSCLFFAMRPAFMQITRRSRLRSYHNMLCP